MFSTDADLKIKDLKVNGKGIFHYINQVKPFSFKEVIDMETLDLGFDLLHGNKIISPFVKDKMIDDKELFMIKLADVIISMYGEKWEKIITTYENDLSLETYNLETTEQVDEIGERKSVRDDISGSERTKLISTFDDDTLTDDEKDLESGTLKTTDTGNTTNNKNVTRIVKGNINNKLSDVNRYLRILKTTVISDIIYKDVIQLIGLSIY